MTVRRLVEMFESLAVSTGMDVSDHLVKCSERGNVHGLVTYYDGLADKSIVTPTVRKESVKTMWEPQPQQVEQKEEEEERQQEYSQPRHQESSEPSAVTRAPSSVVLNFVSKIPPPKSRELHLAACLMRKPVSNDNAPCSRTSSCSSKETVQSCGVPSPTPVSVRARAPAASYAAFVARIENSQSRLLDFEKDERWLEQVEKTKGRVVALKRRNHIALAKEVASTPRKRRSISECSGESTASTASISSMEMMLEVLCQ